MSNRAYVLDTPTTYDCVLMCCLEERPDGSSSCLIRYSLAGWMVSEEEVEISDGQTASWKAGWDPGTHTMSEHFLEQWADLNGLPDGSLGMVVKG